MTGRELIAAIVNGMDDLNKEIKCFQLWRESVGNCVVKKKEHTFHFINEKLYIENTERLVENQKT